MGKSRFDAVWVAVLAISIAGVTLGCDGGSVKPQSIASEERVGQLVEMRKIFDEAGGNWDSLSSEDKAEYTRLAGSEAKAQAMWKTMSSPAGAAPGR